VNIGDLPKNAGASEGKPNDPQVLKPKRQRQGEGRLHY